ncbi:hypothetical protein FHT67_005417 [Paenibacillus sp. BK720]|nr:hypothetical protein [Paenibacillus sp. BK720]
MVASSTLIFHIIRLFFKIITFLGWFLEFAEVSHAGDCLIAKEGVKRHFLGGMP